MRNAVEEPQGHCGEAQRTGGDYHKETECHEAAPRLAFDRRRQLSGEGHGQPAWPEWHEPAGKEQSGASAAQSAGAAPPGREGEGVQGEWPDCAKSCP